MNVVIEMIKIILSELKKKNYLLIFTFFFLIFISIYTLIDSFNMRYQAMRVEYGLYLVVINIALNIVMASLSALMISMSIAFLRFSGRDHNSTLLSGVSVLFGILTYGCTPCVIAFFAVFGITFSVAVLPLAGLPYKLISLLIIIIGLIWLFYSIKNTKCKIK